MDCIAATYSAFDNRAKPKFMEHEKAKNSPAIKAVAVAVIINKIFISVTIELITRFQTIAAKGKE